MTRLALLSDLHSDIVSLDAALAQIKAMDCELIACLGDLVDGDVFPDELIARLDTARIPTIRGNHDRWALERAGALGRAGRRRPDLRDEGPDAVGAAGEEDLFGGGQELSDESLRWLAGLPTSMQLEVEGVRVALHHARPGMWGGDMVGIESRTTSPAQLETLRSMAGAEVLMVGHTHERFAMRVPGGLVANPGALWSGGKEYEKTGRLYVPGAPSYGSFGVLELPAMRFRVYRATDGAVLLDSEAGQ